MEPGAAIDSEGEGERVRQVDDALVLDVRPATSLVGGSSTPPRRYRGSGRRWRATRAPRHGWRSARSRGHRATREAAPGRDRSPPRSGTSRAGRAPRTEVPHRLSPAAGRAHLGEVGDHRRRRRRCSRTIRPGRSRSTPITKANPPAVTRFDAREGSLDDGGARRLGPEATVPPRGGPRGRAYRADRVGRDEAIDLGVEEVATSKRPRVPSEQLREAEMIAVR